MDAGPLFDTNPTAWVVPDRALFAAAKDTGFVCIAGLPTDIPLEPAARARLLSIFGLGAAEKYSLCRRKFAPENRNIYRGWFPLQPGNLTFKEGIDIGGDVAHGPSVTMAGDPLREPSPLPEDDPKVRQPDLTIARSVLAWEPAVPLAAGLEKTIAYFRALLNS